MITETPEQLAAIAAAVARLTAYAEQFEPTQVIDDASGLTADDLDLLIARLSETKNVVSIRTLDLGDPAAVARVIAENREHDRKAGK